MIPHKKASTLQNTLQNELAISDRKLDVPHTRGICKIGLAGGMIMTSEIPK